MNDAAMTLQTALAVVKEVVMLKGNVVFAALGAMVLLAGCSSGIDPLDAANVGDTNLAANTSGSALNPQAVQSYDRVVDSAPKGNMTLTLPGSVALELIWCEPGTFTMGSPSSEVGRFPDEILHEVTLSHGFWLGKHEITQSQYQAITKTMPSGSLGAALPVESISWKEAVKFCQQANEQLAQSLPAGYRLALPTEAQWEYACRAGSRSALNNGQDLKKSQTPNAVLDGIAWNFFNSNQKTHPVGQLKANAWGFYDMHGNVEEWCSDFYSTTTHQQAVTDPKGESACINRACRGGHYLSEPKTCRSAFRRGYEPFLKSRSRGFRIALVRAAS